VVNTGKHTARAAADKFVVREQSTEERSGGASTTAPSAPRAFSSLYTRLQGFLQGRDVFVQDCYAGADPDYRLPVRIITEKAWHSLFARNMFIARPPRRATAGTCPTSPSSRRPRSRRRPHDRRHPHRDVHRHQLRRAARHHRRLGYGGEIKKTVFTVLNYLLPLEGVLPMHCSANVGAGGRRGAVLRPLRHRQDHALGRPARRLIGDDEHGWSDNGIFNFEAAATPR
jgi:phosphoenolpyruvate carboxykinase (ATP)